MAEQTRISGSNDNKHIFILSGQSNMSGRGGVSGHPHKKWDSVVPPECQPHPQILRLSAKLHWEEAHEPLHADIDSKKTCGVGPGMPFARAVRATDPISATLGLVPCAVGGTAISEWEKGSHLCEQMVKRAKESLKEGGEIKALLWFQGESDTNSRALAESYKTKMEKLIEDFRSDLESPSLPIIQVALASGQMEPYIDIVREAQLSIQVDNVVCVDAKGLALKEDNLHLTTEAQVELGALLADAYIKNFTSYSAP